MKCSYCDKQAIYRKGDLFLCKEHFVKYFEEKVIRTIEKYNLISQGEKIGVAVSGGKDSNALLYFLNKYKEYFGIKVIGIHIDEGIEGYRDKDTKKLLEIANKYNIEVKIYRFEEYYKYRLDYLVRNNKIRGLKPCTVCGVWRRWLMWKAAKDIGVDKIATAHNINDEIQTIIINLLEGNIKDVLKEGPKVGILESDFVPRIKPFYFNTEKENFLYSIIHNLQPIYGECPFIRYQIRDIIRSKLYNLEKYYPDFSEKFLENIVELILSMKNKYRLKININLRPCRICGYPTTREICRSCEIKMNYITKE